MIRLKLSAEQLQAGVEANVRWSCERILGAPEVQLALRDKKNILIAGAVYELGTGAVRWLDS